MTVRKLAVASLALFTAMLGAGSDPAPGTAPSALILAARAQHRRAQRPRRIERVLVRLWKTINAAQRDSNVFVSPLSVSFALGMTLNGAATQSYDEMRAALQLNNASLASIDSGYKSLIGLLTSLDPSTTMQIANSIFIEQAIPFNQSFLDDASKWFDAEVKSQNFDDQTGTLSAINGWANTKTNGRIPKVLDQIKPDDVMYLLNAIYFKGSWREKFDPALTREAPFHAATGGDQPRSSCQRESKMSYAETNTFQAVDLAYGDSAFTMTVLLPKSGNDVESVAASLTPEAWQSLTSSFRPQLVNLALPKITFSWKRSLKDDMKALGMRAAFVPDGADFTRMSTSTGKRLYISLLKHDTFVAIDEVGTEAAAVTTSASRSPRRRW
jgi:serpin B